MDRKKPTLLGRVWRAPPPVPLPPPLELDLDLNELEEELPVADWRGSSWDLLNGLEVRDHSDSIPGALFEKLFKP